MHPQVQLNEPTLQKYAEIHTSRDSLRKRRRRPAAGQFSVTQQRCKDNQGRTCLSPIFE
jgi:hypothetical protein